MGNSFNSTLRMPNKPVICQKAPPPPPLPDDYWGIVESPDVTLPIGKAFLFPVLMMSLGDAEGIPLELTISPASPFVQKRRDGRNGDLSHPGMIEILFTDFLQFWFGQIEARRDGVVVASTTHFFQSPRSAS